MTADREKMPGPLEFQQRLLNWNRAQDTPPIKIGNEYWVASQMLALTQPPSGEVGARLREASTYASAFRSESQVIALEDAIRIASGSPDTSVSGASKNSMFGEGERVSIEVTQWPSVEERIEDLHKSIQTTIANFDNPDTADIDPRLLEKARNFVRREVPQAEEVKRLAANADVEEALRRFLDAAAGEGLMLDGIDAGDLFCLLYPED